MSMQRSNSALALSESRKKRSTTNLSNLRLAPLSSKYADNAPREKAPPRTPHEERADHDFTRHHPSYLQGKSAPTTPGILSRSSSRVHLGGGLSRRSSLYEEEDDENEAEYVYGGVSADYGRGVRSEIDGAPLSKTKSDGTLLLSSKHTHRRLASSQLPTKNKAHKRTLTGSNTPRSAPRPNQDDEWLTRACAATNVLLKESKGQSWLSSRETSTITIPDSTDDDDDGYEEAAAQSANTAARLRNASANVSPQMSRWGSRYGSRANSRRGSRRGSTVSMKTPSVFVGHGQESTSGYFDESEDSDSTPVDTSITSPVQQAHPDEDEVARLTAQESFGLGAIVDRLMGFNLFNVDEKDETDDERDRFGDETEQEANARMSAETERRKAEKEKLVAMPAPQTAPNGMVQMESGGWADAAWLLSLATKVMF